MLYDIGDTVTRTMTTTATPTGSPTVAVTAPDGSVSAPTVSGSGLAYSFLVAATQAGTWVATWTAPGLGTEPDAWYVKPNQTAATALIPVVTITQARDFLRATTGSVAETATLARLCKAATLAADYHVRLARTVTHTVTARSGRLYLPRRPVQSVVSATALDGSAALTLATLVVDPTPGTVSVDSFGIYGRYRVVYVGGNFPDDAIEQGALEWVLHRWRASQAHSSSTYGDVGVLGDVAGLPNAVRQCWEPYLDVGIAA